MKTRLRPLAVLAAFLGGLCAARAQSINITQVPAPACSGGNVTVHYELVDPHLLQPNDAIVLEIFSPADLLFSSPVASASTANLGDESLSVQLPPVLLPSSLYQVRVRALNSNINSRTGFYMTVLPDFGTISLLHPRVVDDRCQGGGTLDFGIGAVEGSYEYSIVSDNTGPKPLHISDGRISFDEGFHGLTTVTVTPRTGCNRPALPAEFKVTTVALPAISSPLTDTICSGDAGIVSFTASANSSIHFASISNAAVTGLNQLDYSSIRSSTRSSPETFRYRLIPTMLAAPYCVGKKEIFTLQVNPDPALQIRTPVSICSGDTVRVPLNGGTHYLWKADSVSSRISGATTRSLDYSGASIPDVLVNGGNSLAERLVYRITTFNEFGCRSLDTPVIAVTVFPSPRLTNVSPQVICSGGPVKFVLSASTGGSQFDWWYKSAPHSIRSGDSSATRDTISRLSLTNTSTTQDDTAVFGITITSPSSLHSCKTTTEIRQAVRPVPDFSFSPKIRYCSGDVSNITLSPSYPSTFTWTYVPNSNIANGADGAGNSINQVLTTAGNIIETAQYVVTPTLTGSTPCIGSSKVVSQIVNPRPRITSIGTAGAVCSDFPIQVPLAASIDGAFHWTSGAVSGISVSPSPQNVTPARAHTVVDTIHNHSRSVPATITYTVYVVTDSGCSSLPDINQFSVVSNPRPELLLTVNGAPRKDATICSELKTPIGMSLTTGANSTFTYVAIPDAQIKNASSANGSTLSVIADSLHSDATVQKQVAYAIYGNSAAGCQSQRDTFIVTVNPTPTLLGVDRFSICSDAALAIPVKASTNSGSNSFRYTPLLIGKAIASTTNQATLPDGRTIDDIVTTNGQLTPDSIGYRIVLLNTIGGLSCESRPTDITVRVNPTPQAPEISEALRPAFRLCAGIENIGIGAGKAPDNLEHFVWSIDNGAQVRIIDSNASQFALMSLRNAGLTTLNLTSFAKGHACPSKPDTMRFDVSNTSAPAARVVRFENNLVCQAGSVQRYIWGYDSRSSYASHFIPGAASTQTYFIKNPLHNWDPQNNIYWVMIESEGCFQKAYFNPTAALGIASSGPDGQRLVVYPNPANERITVLLEHLPPGTCSYEVTDLTGRAILRIPATAAATQIVTTSLNAGYYLITCRQNGVRIASSGFIKR